ncbi:unnamed protein product [Haemonchus placei]|uniref:S ribonuclease n=1 Tax=Haemonchus placei TaxID=6290 RepID=A0A0N4X9Q6_HAEPC|nr:unnamed protein product [Haemonchus placei]
MPLSSAAPRSSNEKQEDLLDLDIFGAKALLADIQEPSPTPAPPAEPRLERTSKMHSTATPQKKEDAYRATRNYTAISLNFIR